MQLFQLVPAYSHAINVVLHGINVCLLYIIASRVFERYQNARIAALWATLLYAVHPCLVETVAWISGRFDLLATTLIMAGCTVAMSRATAVRCIFFGVFALGAMLSKEIGVLVAPMLILLALARFPYQPIRITLIDIFPYLLAYMAAAAAYFLLRRQGLGFASYSDFGLPQIISAISHYEGWARKLSFYTFISFMPFSSLTPRHDWAIEMASYRQHAVALIVAVLIMIFVLISALRRRVWALLWSGFYVGIFPVLGIVSIAIGETVGAERFLYLPLAMLALAIVQISLNIKGKYKNQRILSTVGILLGAGWLVISILVTHTVASMWESGLRLWSWQYRINPENTLVRSSYLLEISRAKTPEAAKEFSDAIDYIRVKYNGRLPMEVQFVYANYLLAKLDPESIYYLRGLVENMPTAHEMGQGEQNKKWDENFKSGIFSNYSQALIMFEGNLEEARNSLKKAQDIGVKGLEFNVIHQMIAIDYLEGNKSYAKKMYEDNFKLLQAYNIDKMKKSMGALVKNYCARDHDEEYCRDYVKKFLEYIAKS